MLSVATLIAVSGCFTNPINRAPVITQISQAGNAKGQPATFTAIGADPDQDQLTWTWLAKQGDCPDPKNPANWPHDDTMQGEPDAPATFVVNDPSYTKAAKYCVWAFATDHYGAIGAANLRVIPLDNPPLATIQMVVDPERRDPPFGPPYPAYSTFQLTAVASDVDDDPLTYDWKVDQRPPGSTVDFSPCPGQGSVDDDHTLRCFTADLPGSYVVSVDVSDGIMPVHAMTPVLMVLGDAPPCIQETLPMFSVGAPPLRARTSPGSVPNPGPIKVTNVYDDGNPYPPVNNSKPPQFTWYTSINDAPLRYVDNVDFFRLPLPDAHLGDYVNVRLEVKDEPNAAFIDTILASCLDADFCATPTIPPGRVDCWVRVTWRFHLDQ